MNDAVWFVGHPEVVIDPAIPVPRWHLAPEGIARMRALAARMARPARVWASTECKAIEAAGILAARHGLPVHVDPRLDENDRSATGYLPPPEFQAAADRFFATPEHSFRGWERAVDAQARVLAAWRDIMSRSDGPLAIVGHGGTGTLLFCALAGLPIDRRHDAPRQGCAWLFDRASGLPLHGWRPFEQLG